MARGHGFTCFISLVDDPYPPILAVVEGVVSIKLPHFRRNLPNGTTLRFGNQNLQLFRKLIAIRKIINLEPIDSESDVQGPFVSAEVAGTKTYFTD
jgi:hypothetical protein